MSDSEAKPSADTITVRVKDQAGDETFFKIKNTTKMAKVFKAYATRKGVQGKLNGKNVLCLNVQSLKKNNDTALKQHVYRHSCHPALLVRRVAFKLH